MNEARSVAGTNTKAITIRRRIRITVRGMALGDFVLQNGTLLVAVAVLALIAGVFWIVLSNSMPTIHQFGWQFDQIHE